MLLADHSYEGDGSAENCFEDMQQAEQLGADAIVGVDTLAKLLAQGSMMMVSVSGTAIRL